MSTTLHTTNDRQKLLNALETAAKKGDAEAKQFLERFNQGLLQIYDGTIRSVKQANAVTEFALFDATDEKRAGIYSLSKGVLDRDSVFLVTAIQVLSYQPTSVVGGNTTPTVLNPRSTEEYAAMMASDQFTNIVNTPALANGESYVRINSLPVFDKLSNQVFANRAGRSSLSYSVGCDGKYHLTNPFLIKPQVKIEMNMRLGAATPASQLVEVIFHGATTLPA